jgi:hypothetical protein
LYAQIWEDLQMSEALEHTWKMDPAILYAQIWEDLQMSEALEHTWKMMDPDSFPMALHFLMRYPTEHKQSGIFKICEKSTFIRSRH